MAELTPTNLYGPGGFQENQYVKTTQYQGVKILRKSFFLLEIAVKAIITLIRDVLKGLIGK